MKVLITETQLKKLVSKSLVKESMDVPSEMKFEDNDYVELPDFNTDGSGIFGKVIGSYRNIEDAMNSSDQNYPTGPRMTLKDEAKEFFIDKAIDGDPSTDDSPKWNLKVYKSDLSEPFYLVDFRDEGEGVGLYRQRELLPAEGRGEDDDMGICGACNGSGEGSHDGSRCRVCGGSGVPKRDRSYERDYDDDDYDRPPSKDVLDKEWGGMDF